MPGARLRTARRFIQTTRISSAGIHVPGIARTNGDAKEVALEVGLLRRHRERQEWFVIEDGNDVHLEVTLETARRIVRAVIDDPHLRTELGVTCP